MFQGQLSTAVDDDPYYDDPQNKDDYQEANVSKNKLELTQF